jgi:acetyltransferase-like isoleucine patch superfamily enzyme
MKFNNYNLKIAESAKIGLNVKIGDNVVIYDNVEIGDNSIVCNDTILGEPLNSYYFDKEYINPTLKIGVNSLIRSHNIIYAGSKIGDNFQTGHRVTIRENMIIGNNCSIGTLSDIQGHSVIGNYCRFHSNVHIGQHSTIGNYVFIYPYVVFTNDPHPPSNICIGPIIKDYAQIAVGSIILPGVEIGENVLIGANSVVSRNVEEFALSAGNPAKTIKDTRDIISKETGKPHYPWPLNFKRGMPWEEIGYKKWLEK